MRIAFLVPEFPSISQTFVLNQITGLIDKHHDVEIFALSSSNSDINHNDILKYNLLSRTTYFPNIPDKRIKRFLLGLYYALSYFPKYPALILNSINFIKFGRLALSFNLIFRVLPFLKKSRFDIIFCHFGPLGNIAVQCRLAGALSGKIVTVFHGYDLTSYPRKAGKHVYDTLFKFSDLCLPISNHWKKKLVEMGCNDNKIRVHRMGVNLQHFEFLPVSPKRNGKIKILSIARLVEKKGIEYAIIAISIVRQRFSNIEYVIAGDGPLKPMLNKLISSLNLESIVRIIGFVSQEDIIDLMRNSHILIAPSVTANDGDQEGIPVVLMEAQAMGLPVISTFHSGIPELIIDGHNGLLVQQRDPEALADRIISLIKSESIMNSLRINGRKYIEKHYNINFLNYDLEKLFIEINRKF